MPLPIVSLLHQAPGLSVYAKSVLPWHRSLGPVSISDKTSYRKISRSLEAARLVVKITASLWNLTGTSAALLPRCLSNFRAIEQFYIQISRLRDFTRSYDKTSYRILKRSSGCKVLSLDCQWLVLYERFPVVRPVLYEWFQVFRPVIAWSHHKAWNPRGLGIKGLFRFEIWMAGDQNVKTLVLCLQNFMRSYGFLHNVAPTPTPTIPIIKKIKKKKHVLSLSACWCSGD